jgi:hypothetical protein
LRQLRTARSSSLATRQRRTHSQQVDFATFEAAAAASNVKPRCSTSRIILSLPFGVSGALACCIPGLREGRELRHPQPLGRPGPTSPRSERPWTGQLDLLGASSPGPWFGWSHHNHKDIELDAGQGNTPPSGQPGNPQNAAAKVRSLLTNRWYGWNSTSAADPKVLLTEGGARLDAVRDYWFTAGGTPSPDTIRNKQRELLERNYNRMRNTSDGNGISLMMYYLFTSDYAYDCGLRDCYVYGDQDMIL